MSLSALATGTLIKPPEQRTGSSGKPFVLALIRVACEDGEPIIVSAIAFGEDARRHLMALGKGDEVSVAGKAKVTSWERGGEQKHGLSIVAEQAMSAYTLTKKRKALEPA